MVLWFRQNTGVRVLTVGPSVRSVHPQCEWGREGTLEWWGSQEGLEQGRPPGSGPAGDRGCKGVRED